MTQRAALLCARCCLVYLNCVALAQFDVMQLTISSVSKQDGWPIAIEKSRLEYESMIHVNRSDCIAA